MTDKEQIRKLFSESAGKAKNVEPESMNDFLILRLTGLSWDEIRELKERDTAKAPEEIQDAFGDARLICPNCRNSVINYFNRSRPPQFCMICGQRLQWEDRRCRN